MQVAFADPDNARVLAYLRRGFDAQRGEAESAPPSLEQLARRALPTSPQLARRLWHELTISLPEPCAWIVYARAVLVHPGSGIIFAFAVGARTYALRLDAPDHAQALQLGARHLQLDRPWTLGDGREEEAAWCLAAYRAAG